MPPVGCRDIEPRHTGFDFALRRQHSDPKRLENGKRRIAAADHQHVLAFNTPSAPEKTKAVMEALGCETSGNVTSVFDAAYAFCAELGIEMKLSGLGVPESDLDAM